MERSEVLAVYDDPEFVASYNDLFLFSPWAKHGVDIELDILSGLHGEGKRWLDLCCGTGWFLAQFPEVERAGLDLSSAMIAEARAANPDANVLLRQGDVCADVTEWHGRWDLVTCMWMAYCYLESMREVETMIDNMIGYVAPGGSACMTSVIDLEDLRPHTVVPYEENPDIWGGRIAVTGYTWTWEEPNGHVNENMMAIHVGHVVRLLEPHFAEVEVVRYPLIGPGHVSRKAVARGRRALGETGEATVTWNEVPVHPDAQRRSGAVGPAVVVEVGENSLASVSTKSLVQEFVRRLRARQPRD